MKLSSMLMGMAMPTNTALRRPRKNMSTPTTSSTPKMMEFSSSSTWVRVWSLRSPVMVTVRSLGNTSRSKRCSSAFTLSLATSRLRPLRLMMSSITTGWPNSRA